MFHQESSHSPLAKLFIAILDFKMLALDVKMEAFETLKVAYCLAKQCLSFYFAVGCGGVEGAETSRPRSRWRLRRKLSPSRPSLCIESVPVLLLPQFPPLLNIGPETTVVVARWFLPQGRFSFVVPF